MAIATYSDLQTAASSNWPGRADLATRVVEFITLAEAKINRALRAREMLVTTDNFGIGSEYVGLPVDFLEMYSLYLNSSVRAPIQMVSSDAATNMYPTSSGTPKFVTVVGNNLRFSPPPDTSYTATLTYYARIPALSSTVTTNWLLTNHPDIYLYATLVEAAPFLGDDNRLSMWAGMLKTAADQLETAGRRAQSLGPSMATRPL